MGIHGMDPIWNGKVKRGRVTVGKVKELNPLLQVTGPASHGIWKVGNLRAGLLMVSVEILGLSQDSTATEQMAREQTEIAQMATEQMAREQTEIAQTATEQMAREQTEIAQTATEQMAREQTEIA
ncbi:hypothetical protein, partial [Lentibacillus kapialis]|uniref:hypothetical protein n=1 Tax=Lentibacillus kapialis TaxID=340214 RepID=UPI0016683922